MIVLTMPKEAKEMFNCAHAVEIGESKKMKGKSLWQIFNRRWQKVWPKAIYAECEIEALIKCKDMIQERLFSLAKSKAVRKVDFK
jgi:hypothetical protein